MPVLALLLSLGILYPIALVLLLLLCWLILDMPRLRLLPEFATLDSFLT